MNAINIYNDMKIIYKGTSVHYIKENFVGEKGKGEKEQERENVLLFLHGWGGNCEIFLPFAKTLGKPSILVDFPPFGSSEEPKEKWEIEDYMKAILVVLSQEKVKSVQIIAHSFGGRVALCLASSYPLFVKKMILVGCAGIKPKFNLPKALKICYYKLWGKRKKSKGKVYGSLDYRVLSSTMQKTFLAIIHTDQRKCLPLILAPTLLVFGEEDKETPLYMAKILNRGIAGSGLVTYKNAGHFVFATRCFEFSALLKNFLT